jgi:hypothetical protein
MVGLFNFQNVTWILTALLEVTLLFDVLQRKFYRSYPAFFAYVLAVILQAALMAGADAHWGSTSKQAWMVAWSSQPVVLCARWCAVVEIARKVLAGYGGIQRMATRILMVLGVCMLAYSFVFSRFIWALMVLNADRAVELCIATFVVCMFVFARYYRLPMLNLERQLAIGFCLYSCAWVINDSIFENRPGAMWDLFYHLNVLAFLASLLLWIGAVRAPAEARSVAPETQLSPEMYGQLSEKLNSRLNLLNHRLDHLFRSGDSQL